MKISYLGTILFAILLALTIIQIKKRNKLTHILIKTGVVGGSLLALYFFYLQEFILKAYCKYCLVVDTTMILSLIITIIYWKK